ncbi:hypothetical protein L1049_021784 [Liquidambar formosana]|uniref:Uncharacterized protein n=1 Tax=Liquidambar formosana TaxID=63359 RepID=A0AAP0RCL3_LIQFO
MLARSIQVALLGEIRVGTKVVVSQSLALNVHDRCSEFSMTVARERELRRSVQGQDGPLGHAILQRNHILISSTRNRRKKEVKNATAEALIMCLHSEESTRTDSNSVLF